MKNYKTINNEVHSFENNVSEEFLNKKIKELELIETTEEKITEIRNQIELDNHTVEKTELYSLQSYLTSTDYMVIKCYERKQDIEVKYPEDFIKRQEARDRINVLRNLLQN